MHIGILSFRPLLQEIAQEEQRLLEAAEAAGHQATVFRSGLCQLIYDEKGERVFYEGKPFPKIDALIPRASILTNVELRLAIVKQFELMEVPVLNTYQAIAKAKNKLRTMQILHARGIPVPRTMVMENDRHLNEAIEAVGGVPVIIKDPFGSFGSGVVIAESKRAARSVLDNIWKGGYYLKPMLIQEYLEESGGRDTRVFVVGGRVVAGMERSAQAEEFRSNMELGGEAKPIEVSDEYAKIAIEATAALGLEISGVDIIESAQGPVVLEVNANPGFKGLEETTGVDVAGAIIDFASNR